MNMFVKRMLLVGLVLTAVVAPVHSNAGIGWEGLKRVTSVSVGALGGTWLLALIVKSVEDAKHSQAYDWYEKPLVFGSMAALFLKLFYSGVSE